MSTDISEEWDFAAAARAGQPGPADWRKDTLTSFPAIRDDTPPPAGDAQESAEDAPQPCPCGSGMALSECNGQRPGEPGTATLLSCAEGVTSRIWRTRVASGEWDDIPARADRGHARVHLPALDGNRRIRAGVAGRLLDIGAVLRADPSALGDPQLDRDLCRVEDWITDQAVALRRWVAERAAQIRDEAAREAVA